MRHQHICGSAILNEHWVITAAACTHKQKDVTQVFVRTGSLTFNARGTRHSVTKIVNHPKYNDGSRVNDIALVRTRTQIVRNELTGPVALPRSDISRGAATVAGWGQRDIGVPSKSLQLRTLTTSILSAADCKKELKPSPVAKYLTATNVCTSAGEGRGFCRGDIGGPLTVGTQLVGIGSFADDCGSGMPDVYTRVFAYVKWIQDTAF